MKYGEGNEVISGIRKETVAEAFLTKEGFRRDGVADVRFHGGADRAVCVYPYEHYVQWEKEFGEPLPPSSFGENLTVSNMLESGVHIGDIFRLGDAVIQVTQSRIPFYLQIKFIFIIQKIVKALKRFLTFQSWRTNGESR